MTKIEIFDPPMCCSTGICGNSSDPTLVNFASDIEWLKKQGVEVIRHGLALEPTEFAKNEAVKNLLNKKGNDCLPIITIGTTIISDSCYPSREQLASMCKVQYNDDEAPPIHREENCCCGVDCDCGTAQVPDFDYAKTKCNCSNAASEDNCYCEQDFNSNSNAKNSMLKAMLICGLLFIIFFGVSYLIYYAFNKP